MRSRIASIASLAIVGLLASGSTSTAGTIAQLEVLDTGPDAIVVAHRLELGNSALKLRSNRIEVSLRGKPPAQSIDVDDPTIAKLGVRIRSSGERRLTITLRGGRDAARRLIKRARLRQVGGTAQVILARKPTDTPVAAFIEDFDLDDNGGDGVEAIEEAAPKDDEAASAATAKTAPETKTQAKASAGNKASASSIVGLLLIFVAAVACGLGYREWQRRRSGAPTVSGIEVLSSRAIGPKTRLMLVAVGAREMLLTVGPAGSTVLGRWRRNDAASDASFDDDLVIEPVHARPIAAPPLEAPPLAAPLAPPEPPGMLVPRPPAARTASRQTASRQTASRPTSSRPANPAVAAINRRTQQSAAPVARRTVARGSSNPNESIAEWNHRPTSPAIRGILELRDQTVALEDVLGQGDDDVDIEWEQALAGGTRAGRLR